MALEHFDQGEGGHSLSTWQKMHDESMHEYYHSHSDDMHDHNLNELFHDEEVARRKREQDMSYRRNDYSPSDGHSVQEYKSNEAIHENYQRRIFSSNDLPEMVNDIYGEERRNEEHIRTIEDEQRRQEDDRRKQEDDKRRQEEERRRQEEERRRQEDSQYGDNKPNEIAERRRQEDERNRQEEERRRQEEERRRQEDARRRAEDDRRRMEDERRLRRQEDAAHRNRPSDINPHHDYRSNNDSPTVQPVYGASTTRNMSENSVKYGRETIAYAKDTTKEVYEAGKMVYHEIDNLTGGRQDYGIFKDLTPTAIKNGATYSAATMAAGASMILASTVAQIVNASRVDRAEREYAAIENRDSQLTSAAQEIDKKRSLSEYRESVDVAKTIRDSGIQERKALTNSQLADVNKELKAITTKYDSELKSYTDKQSELKSSYKSATEAYEHRVAEIKQNRTSQLSSIQETARQQMANQDKVHESRISRIESSTGLSASDKAARIASENAAHQKEMSRIQSEANRSITRVDQNISSQLAAEKKSFSKTTSTYNNSMQSLQKNIDGLQQTRTSACTALEQRKSTIMLEHKEAIKQLQTDYKQSGETAKTVKTGAEAATLALAAHSATPSNTKLKGAAKLQDIALNNQRDIAQAAVELFGDDKQKQLVRAAIADSKAEAEAKKNKQVYISPLSQKDKNEAEKALASVGGMTALSSSKEVAKSLDSLNKMLPKVQMQIDSLVNEEKGLADKISGLKQQLAADKQALKESNQAQKILKSGKDANGKELTADAQKALSAKVLTKEKATALRNKLSAGQTSLNGLQAKMNELTKNKNALAALQVKIGKQKEFLSKNGKIIAKPNADKKSASQSKKGRKMVSRSISNINKSMNRLFGGRQNGIDRAFSGNLYYDQQSRELVHQINTMTRLVNVGVIATKMITQLTVKPLKMCVSSTRIFQNVRGKLMSKYANFAGNHKFLAKGISGAGKFVVGAPGFILKNAGNAVNYALNPDQALKDGAKWAGRKTGNFVLKTTMKGVKGVTVRTGRLAGKGIKFAKKQVGRGAKVVGRGMKKGFGALYKNTLGKTKVGKAAANATKWAARQVKKIAQAAKKVVKTTVKFAVKLLKLPFAAIKALISFLMSLLSSIISFLLPVIGWALIFLSGAMVVIVIMSLLLSVIMAIGNILDRTTAGYQNKVSSSPSYIANIASNYRNTELMILEFFKDGTTENVYTEEGKGGVVGTKHKIEVNNNPIYYAVFDNTFDWFGALDKEGEKDLNFDDNGERVSNTQAENLYNEVFQYLSDQGYNPYSKSKNEKIKHWWDYIIDFFVDTYEYLAYNFSQGGTFAELDGKKDDDFKSVVTYYDKVSVSYFMGAKGEPGTFQSSYEVSNAKDALAMMDSIYTIDPDMQRVEVLRYLGVGDYQLQTYSKDNAAKRKMLYNEDDVNNLFWNSHEIVYKKGASYKDITFPHGTYKSGDNYIVSSMCDNKSKMEIKYTVKQKDHADYSGCVKKQETQYIYVGCYSHSGCSFSRRIVYGDPYKHYFCSHGAEIVLDYNEYKALNCPNVVYPSGGYLTYKEWVPDYSKPCNHYHDEKRTMTIEYCLGHINLETEIYVTVIKPENDSAKNLMDIAAQLTPLSGSIGNGLWTWSDDLNIHGFGGDEIKPINPSEHWDESKGDCRGLATGKIEAEITYTCEKDSFLGVDSTTILEVKRGPYKNTKLLIKSSADDLLLFPFRLYGNEFFIPDMKSGEQKEIISRPSADSTAEEIISIKRSSTGTYYTKVSGS